MELIVINDSKLKIMLSPDDMKEFDLDCDSVDYSSTETRRAFWSILDEAKHRTGFDAASQRIYIQLYPSRQGGCEMYVTKIGNAKSPDIFCDDQKRYAYIFNSLDLMIRVCRQLESIELDSTSDAFSDDSGHFLLLLGVDPQKDIPNLSFVNEFGESLDFYTVEPYIAEHCKRICSGNAVLRLASLS
jgi:negative regulator of genetic competence, sporulation and motility